MDELAAFLTDLEQRLGPLERRLAPFLDQGPAPGESAARYLARLAALPTPLDRDTALRQAFDRALDAACARYGASDAQACKAIRACIERHPAVAWFAVTAVDVMSEPVGRAALRRALLMLSMGSAVTDGRDLLSALDRLCDRARGAGWSIDADLRAIAAQSDPAPRPVIGSVRDCFLSRTGK